LLILARNELGVGKEILSLRVLRSEADASTRVRENSSSIQSSSGASVAPVEELQAEEKFNRFSAYANDRRVTTSGALLPGTYATTEEDASMLKQEEMPWNDMRCQTLLPQSMFSRSNLRKEQDFSAASLSLPMDNQEAVWKLFL
jgi:hypothetical protein